MESAKLVSLVVPVKDNLEYTKLMLSTYREHTLWPGKELIFVDNGSESDTLAYLKRQKDVDVAIRLDANVGFAAGVNAGMEEAQGDVVGILNNDILLSHGWLGKLMRVFEQVPDVGIASPVRVGNVDGYPGILPWQVSSLKDYPDHSFTRRGKLEDILAGMHEFTEKVEESHAGAVCLEHTMLPFFCTLIRREVIDELGMLDEDFGIGLTEDTHYCHRAIAAGWKLASCLDCYVHHFMSKTLIKELGSMDAIHEVARRNALIMHKKEAALGILK
jgi:GT2 family glycosyltransferase